MAALVVQEVVPADVVDVVGTHPDTGRPVRRTTWSGVVAIRPDVDDGTSRYDQAVSFFVPDSRPFPKVAMTGVRTAARVALAGVPLAGPDTGRLEVDRASATITPDPRGGDHAWLEVHLQLRGCDLVAAAPWRLAYQVDLALPHRPPADG